MKENLIDKSNSLDFIKFIYKSKYKSNANFKYNIAESFYNFENLLSRFNLKIRNKFYKNTNLYYFKISGKYLYFDENKTNNREFLEDKNYISFFIDDTLLVKKESKINIVKRIIYQYKKTFSFASLYIFTVNFLLFIFIVGIKNTEIFDWKINVYFFLLSLFLALFLFYLYLFLTGYFFRKDSKKVVNFYKEWQKDFFYLDEIKFKEELKIHLSYMKNFLSLFYLSITSGFFLIINICYSSDISNISIFILLFISNISIVISFVYKRYKIRYNFLNILTISTIELFLYYYLFPISFSNLYYILFINIYFSINLYFLLNNVTFNLLQKTVNLKINYIDRFFYYQNCIFSFDIKKNIAISKKNLVNTDNIFYISKDDKESLIEPYSFKYIFDKMYFSSIIPWRNYKNHFLDLDSFKVNHKRNKFDDIELNFINNKKYSLNLSKISEMSNIHNKILFIKMEEKDIEKNKLYLKYLSKNILKNNIVYIYS